MAIPFPTILSGFFTGKWINGKFAKSHWKENINAFYLLFETEIKIDPQEEPTFKNSSTILLSPNETLLKVDWFLLGRTKACPPSSNF